jgi:hypothetical protein
MCIAESSNAWYKKERLGLKTPAVPFLSNHFPGMLDQHFKMVC